MTVGQVRQFPDVARQMDLTCHQRAPCTRTCYSSKPPGRQWEHTHEPAIAHIHSHFRSQWTLSSRPPASSAYWSKPQLVIHLPVLTQCLENDDLRSSYVEKRLRLSTSTEHCSHSWAYNVQPTVAGCCCRKLLFISICIQDPNADAVSSFKRSWADPPQNRHVRGAKLRKC